MPDGESSRNFERNQSEKLFKARWRALKKAKKAGDIDQWTASALELACSEEKQLRKLLREAHRKHWYWNVREKIAEAFAFRITDASNTTLATAFFCDCSSARSLDELSRRATTSTTAREKIDQQLRKTRRKLYEEYGIYPDVYHDQRLAALGFAKKQPVKTPALEELKL